MTKNNGGTNNALALIVSFPRRNGPVSYGTVCGLNNDMDVTLKGKCDSEVVLIANRCAKLKTLDELKNKEE